MGSLLQQAHRRDPRNQPVQPPRRSGLGATMHPQLGMRGQPGPLEPHSPQPHCDSHPQRRRKKTPTAMTLMKAVRTQGLGDVWVCATNTKPTGK